MDEALRYTAAWRNEHLEAAGQHSVARNLNALVAFPAGAVGAFYAISGHGSTDRITRLALGSATVYGATSFLAPQGKQRAYLEGALALSCVMDATLNVRRSETDLDQLSRLIDQVRGDQVHLESLLSVYARDLPDSSPTLARAAVARDNALNLLGRAHSIRTAHENAGLRAAFATERIVTQTAILASRHESNLDSLMAMVSNLRGTAGSFGLSNLPAPTAVDPKAISRQSAGSRQDQAMDAIEKAIDALVGSTTNLLVVVRSLEVPAATTDVYALCNPSDVATDFSVTPTDAAQSVQAGATLDFQITNNQNNAFPSHSVSGDKADAIVVSGPLVKNGKLTITVTGKEPTGGEPVTLTITDPTGKASKSYQITVLPTEAGPPAEKEQGAAKLPAAQGGAPAGFASAYTIDNIKELQCRLGLVGVQSDGVIGSITYSALGAFANKHKIALGPVLSQKLFDEVMKQTDQCTRTPS